MDYLQQEEIGGVIAKGLAMLYLEEPKFPIDYLAKWLLTYCHNQEEKQNFQAKETEKLMLIKKQENEIKIIQQQEEQEFKKLEQSDREQLIFREKIFTAQYHEELLKNEFCDFIKKSKNFQGVYVCELNFPHKEFQDLVDDDEYAHLDLNGIKLLRYIAGDADHQFLLNQTLVPDTGVTYEALKEPQPNEEGLVIENNGIYIADVVRDSRIVYHRWPKLGAFYGVPLIYNSSIHDEAFDKGVEQRQQFLKNKEEQKREREVKEQEYDEIIQGKIEAGENTTQIEQELQNFRDQQEELKEAPFLTVKREFVLCIDTLGMDREISEQDRKYVLEQAKLFSENWESRERQALSDDIDRQLKYIDTVNNYKDILEQQQQEEDLYVEANLERLEYLKDKNEKEYLYEQECLRLEKQKEQLLDRSFMTPLIQLGEYRLLKYPAIIQAALYLIGYDKKQINLPETNILNLKYFKSILDETLIEKILSYSHRGPKEQPKFPYSMINRVQKRLEKFDQDQVDNYCLPYGKLLKIILMNCRLRKQDIEIRRAKIDQKKQLNIQLREEKIRINEEREKSLKSDLEQMTPEEQEAFNQEEWDILWDTDHPLPEIPEDPQDEIDLDYEFDQ